MSKMKKRMIGIGILCTVIVGVVIAMLPQENKKGNGEASNQTKLTSNIGDEKENDTQSPVDEEKVSTVGGEIIKVSEGSVTFQANPNNLGSQFYVSTLNTPIFDANGNKISVDKLQKGKHITVKFTGNIQESWPAKLLGVVAIIVTTPNGNIINDEPHFEGELVEETPYGVLYDVVVAAEHTADDTVEITLTNTSEFVVTKWIVTYESAYTILEIENAELILNVNKLKQFKALEENNTLESGQSVTITLETDGTYHDDTKYRVYGYSDGLPEDSQVVDMINYNAATQETTLIIYDIDEDDLQGPTTTQGLDVN